MNQRDTHLRSGHGWNWCYYTVPVLALPSLLNSQRCLPSPTPSQAAEFFTSREFHFPGWPSLLLLLPFTLALCSSRLLHWAPDSKNGIMGVTLLHWKETSYFLSPMEGNQGTQAHGGSFLHQEGLHRGHNRSFYTKSTGKRPRIANAWRWEINIFRTQEIIWPNWNRRYLGILGEKARCLVGTSFLNKMIFMLQECYSFHK